ncbi:hypothetical protein [Rugamonas aquatica]|uniref:Uncharacterized protein n=1 Tax=Rugamonas aquatica TaxID=2743357 RepID=A0A6A7N666_9BURK|nr:hypothetical protein [Rugamonas aquatica]MQA40583.1 hypothetical protein [Rugamonas aquatica]
MLRNQAISYRGFIRNCTLACALLIPAVVLSAPHKVIDLRKMSDSSGEYSVSLCARPSPGSAALPGHAFVAFSFIPASGGDPQFVALGFTTNSAVKGLLSFSALLATPTGYLKEEILSHVQENCLVALVNRQDFDNAYAKTRLFAGLPGFGDSPYIAVYSLTQNDCVTFMTGVASVLDGVTVPERNLTDLPMDYMRKLIDAN